MNEKKIKAWLVGFWHGLPWTGKLAALFIAFSIVGGLLGNLFK
jgi:hypothetical protein